MILSLYRFRHIVLWRDAVRSNSKHGSFNVQHCFAGGGGGGTLSNKTINSLCNDNKVALN